MSGESAAPGSSTVMTIVTFIEENRESRDSEAPPPSRGSLAGGRGRGCWGRSRWPSGDQAAVRPLGELGVPRPRARRAEGWCRAWVSGALPGA